MKESNWEECLETNSSVKISSNISKVKSLKDTALGRIEFLEKNKIDESNANYIFEAYYSSILELMHGIILLEGYKVSNHICLGYYLRDIMKEENLFRLFNDCRYKRNSLVYYGRKMDFEVAKEAICKSKDLIKMLLNMLEENI